MKNVKMVELPDCAFCDKKAEYDNPLLNSTSWAYLCEEHYRLLGKKVQYGYRLIING